MATCLAGVFFIDASTGRVIVGRDYSGTIPNPATLLRNFAIQRRQQIDDYAGESAMLVSSTLQSSSQQSIVCNLPILNDETNEDPADALLLLVGVVRRRLYRGNVLACLGFLRRLLSVHSMMLRLVCCSWWGSLLEGVRARIIAYPRTAFASISLQFWRFWMRSWMMGLFGRRMPKPWLRSCDASLPFPQRIIKQHQLPRHRSQANQVSLHCLGAPSASSIPETKSFSTSSSG